MFRDRSRKTEIPKARVQLHTDSPPNLGGESDYSPPKAMDSPPKWRGNPLFWGGNRYGVELWILWFGLFRDRPRKMLTRDRSRNISTKHFHHLKSFKKQVFEISIFEIVFFSTPPNVPGVEWSYSSSTR